MPPHCDSKDGPVVKAAQMALDKNKVELILPFVKKDAEEELRETFNLAMTAREHGGASQVVADEYFFENAVRLHRQGEGATYTGLKPAGLDVGPVIPLAEKAIEFGSAENLTRFLTETISEQVHHRLEQVKELQKHVGEGVEAAREYTEAMLGLQVWSHKLYLASQSSAHEGHEHHE